MTITLPPVRHSIEDAKRDLDEVGLTRFVGAADEVLLDAVRRRLDEQAAGEDAHGCAFRDGGDVVANVGNAPNQRVWNLINKGDAFRRLVMNEAALTLVRHLLGEDILLFSLTANIANKGGAAQPLHGDQRFAPPNTPYPLIVNCAWMLDPFTADNGATRVVPGSHRIAQWPEEGLPSAADFPPWHEDNASIETAPATGPAGAIMVWDGRLWHGTGANHTDQPRRGILAAYCKPFQRQQENFALSVDPAVLEGCTPELRALLGFQTWYGLGMVEGSRHGEFRARPDRFTHELRP